MTINNIRPKWLIGSITGIEYDAYRDKIGIYFKYEKETYYNELSKDDFKPFYWKHIKKDGLFDSLHHKQTIKEVKAVKKQDGKAVHMLRPDTQFLIQKELTYFENIGIDDLRIAVVDIETTSLSPTTGHIISFGIKTNFDIKHSNKSSNDTIFFNDKISEKTMLEDFIYFLQDEDPDLIIGHNIFNFDIPYIEGRLQANNIDPALGRSNKNMYKDYMPTKVHNMIVGKEFIQYRIPGRHIIDTMHLAMIEDTRRSEFENVSLKYLAKHLKIAKPDRTYLEGHEIAGMYKTDFDKFMAYLTDDLEETMGLTKMFLPAYIQMSKIIPINLQDQIYAGPTQKFSSLFCRDYYKQKKAIPMPAEREIFKGAKSNAEAIGVFNNVAKFDVASLYPSIQLVYNIFPKTDSLGSFKKFLSEFKIERLKFKALMEEEETNNGKTKLYEEYNAYQLALKILINSFYGVLGNNHFLWNDFKAAGDVTAKGREILQIMMNTISNEKCTLISVDTDGAYFSYPENVNPKDVLAKVNAAVGEGIDVEFEKEYIRMFSYAGKNYAALSKDDKILIKGSAFKNRTKSKHFIKFIKNFLNYILHEQPDKILDELFLLKRSIADRTLHISDIIEKQTISFDWYQYKARETGGKMKVFEAMERENKVDSYKKGDQVMYYIMEGDMKLKSDVTKLYNENDPDPTDYNIDHYINVLNDWFETFEPLIHDYKRQLSKNI